MLHNIYIWLTYKSKTGSAHSKLLAVRDQAVVSRYIKEVNNADPYMLYYNRPSWLNVYQMEISIQDFNTSETLYRRILDVEVSYSCAITQKFRGEKTSAFNEYFDNQNK